MSALERLQPGYGPLARCALVLVLMAGATSAQDYEIRFDRPLKAGMKYRMATSSSGKMSLTAKVNGEVVMDKPTASSEELDADVLIASVNEKGKASRIEYTIRTFISTRLGTETVVLPPGAVVVAVPTTTNRPDFSLKDGSAISPPVMKELHLLGASMEMAPYDYDQPCGTRERKAPGAEWPIDKKQAMALTLAPAEIPEEFKRVVLDCATFSVRLDGVEKCNSMDCLRLSVKMGLEFDPAVKEAIQKMVQKSPPAAQSIGETTIENMKTGGTVSLLCPVDTSAPLQGLQMTGQMEIQTRMKDPDGKETVVNLAIEHTIVEKRTYGEHIALPSAPK